MFLPAADLPLLVRNKPLRTFYRSGRLEILIIITLITIKIKMVSWTVPRHKVHTTMTCDDGDKIGKGTHVQRVGVLYNS